MKKRFLSEAASKGSVCRSAANFSAEVKENAAEKNSKRAFVIPA